MTIRAVPAVTRAVAILRLLGRSRAPLGVKAISQALDLVPSTGLHILRVLVAEELVKVDPVTKQYSLGSGVLSLARTALHRRVVGIVAQTVAHHVVKAQRLDPVTSLACRLPCIGHDFGMV